MVEENETEEGSGETQEEGGVEGDDAVKTKKPNGFDMFSDDLSMFAEAHSVSSSVVWLCTHSVHLYRYLLLRHLFCFVTFFKFLSS